MRTFPIVGLLLAAAGSPALGAAPDNDVEWAGVSHVPWQDRRPLCPVGGEAFQVRFQTYRNDITAARLQVNDGVSAWVSAAKIGTRGPYDLWAAQIPATAADSLRYFIELTDLGDTDYYSVGGMSDGPPTDGGFVLDFITLDHAPVGATLVTGGAVFKVWAPTRSVVHVRGEFDWVLGTPMTKVGEHFIAFVPGVSDRQQYKYFFNNSVWNTDARARALNPNDNLNAFLENPFRYSWRVPDFATPALEQMVIYQLHVGTFAGRNDPAGGTPLPSRYVDVAARAGHLAELGVNAVLLNPITEFPGDFSAGYNPQSAWAPEWKYGSPDDLKNLIDTLHEHGIAVLLDIVWNHFTVNGNFLWYYDGSQIYFDTPHVDTPWGAQADFDRAAVRDYFANSALHWLEEYRVDGFRMDATEFMTVFPQEPAGWSLMQRMNDEVDNRWTDKVAIAEQLPDDAAITRPTALGGAGFDAQYYDAFVDQLRQEILDAAFGDPEMWRIRNIVNGGGTYLSGRRVLNYFELHDEAWPENGGERMVKTIDPSFPHDDVWARSRVTLAQGIVLLAPGIPAFLMGTEWLEDAGFGTQAENRIDWSKKVTYAPVFRYFQDLVALRRSRSALRADADRQVFHLNEGANVLAFRRFTAESTLVVIANFSNLDYSSYRIGLPKGGDWEETLNNQASRYGGMGIDNPGAIVAEPVAADGFAQSTVIAVPRMGLVVLAPALGPVAVGGTSATVSAPGFRRIVPNPARSVTRIEYVLPRAGTARIELFDVRGRRIRSLFTGRAEAGPQAVGWDGRDDAGGRVAPGLYFVRLAAPGGSATTRLAVTR